MKKITSLSLGLSFIIMTYTGFMLFVCPHGRVAYWSDWHLLGFSKDQYGQIHTTSMIVMVIFGFLHIYYNWKPIVNYMKNKAKEVTLFNKDFLIALFINLIVIVGTLTFMPPFKTFLDMEENIKDSWIATYGEPPYGHAELSSLKVFCKRAGLDYNKVIKKFTQLHIVFDAKDTIKAIAVKNNKTPQDIYNLIKELVLVESVQSTTVPTGLGQKSLESLASKNYIILDKSISFLKTKGISVSKDDKLKSIADKLDMTPFDLYNLIKIK